jgi:hypothetical protein
MQLHYGDQVHPLKSGAIKLRRQSLSIEKWCYFTRKTKFIHSRVVLLYKETLYLSLEEWCYCIKENTYPSFREWCYCSWRPHTHPLNSSVIALERLRTHPLESGGWSEESGGWSEEGLWPSKSWEGYILIARNVTFYVSSEPSNPGDIFWCV